MTLVIPQPLKMEHDELHVELAAVTRRSGAVGEAAKAVAQLMHPHFVKEEEYALPPLGLLSILAQGGRASDADAVLSMTRRLKANLDEMLAEHKAIFAALERLAAVARNASLPEVERFAARLILHARTEEEVLYPAAILVGEHLERRLRA